MSNTIRIAHISDLHLGLHHPQNTEGRTRQILTGLRSHRIDHLAVTGDISANGDRRELALFRSLAGAGGFLEPGRLSVVVGNHDIYGGVHFAEDLISFPSRCRNIDYGGQLRQFVKHVPESFEGALLVRHKEAFPYIKPLGPVLLVGMNTVARYSRIRNPVGSNGEVDDDQFRTLTNMFGMKGVRGTPKIVLLHHHFLKDRKKPDGTMHSLWSAIEQQTMKLRGKKRLLRLFAENNVKLVLHGHVHENAAYERKSISFLNGGGSVMPLHHPWLYFNIIEASPTSVRWWTESIAAGSDPERTLPSAAQAPAALLPHLSIHAPTGTYD